MSGFFLRLDLDKFGIKAMLLEQNFKNVLPKDHYDVLFKDLPELEEDQDPFDAGLDIIAQHIDLTKCSNAVLFVSSLTVFFRNMELPFRSEKKIRQVLPFELEPFLPHGDENHISDFHRLNIDHNPNLILTASFPEFQIGKYVSKLEDLGIKPAIITPGGYAAAVSFLNERKDLSSFIFLHVTDSEYTLVIILDRKPCMVRAFSSSQYETEALTTAVKQSILGFKQRTGLEPLSDVFIYSAVDNKRIKEICNAFDNYPEEKSGVGAVEPGIGMSIPKNLIESSLLSAITPETRMKYFFNFCKGKYGSYSFLKTYFNHLAAGFVFALILFTLSLFSINIDISKLDRKIAKLDQKALSLYNETFPGEKRVQDPYLQMKANLKAASKKVGAYKNNDSSENQGVQVSDLLLELSKRIAPSIDVDASRFIFNNGRLILAGSTDNFNNVDKIKNQIEGSYMFKDVRISSAAMDKKGNRVNFKFIIEM